MVWIERVVLFKMSLHWALPPFLTTLTQSTPLFRFLPSLRTFHERKDKAQRNDFTDHTNKVKGGCTVLHLCVSFLELLSVC